MKEHRMMAEIPTLLAHSDAPARGAPLEDVVGASVVAVVVVAALVVLARAYRKGGAAPLRRAGEWTADSLGLPVWTALPTLVVLGSLIVAVFGYYWDVATHIDNGRDPGPFANPSHFFILAGLAGIALAGYLSILFAEDCEARTAIRFRTWTMPLGGLLLLVTGVVALAGFPLDDTWHRLFGQDVTLWGPTHIQMIGGGSLATLAVWILLAEARPFRTAGRWSFHRTSDMFVAGGFLVALSTLQGEFDYGVPQFRLVFHPVLLMLAASIGLVVARICLGAGGALKAALFFIALRGVMSLVIGPGLGRITMHFPLYLAEAAIVEVIALRMSPARTVTFGLVAGAGMGTAGLGAEWAWSHLWMPISWPAQLLPEAAVLGLAAALAGGAIGGMIGHALSADRTLRIPLPAVAAAGVAAIFCLAWPAPLGSGSPVTAEVTVDEVREAPHRTAVITARLDPPDAAEDAVWWHGLAWQGLDWDRGSSKIVELEKVDEGVYRTVRPLPVGGDWKSLLRLHVDDRLLAVPVYLPQDSAIPAPEVPARSRFERSFVTDKQIVQREAITPNIWLQRIAYSVLLLIGVVWIAIFGWALRRLGHTDMRVQRTTPTVRAPVRSAAPT
jgi:hypothetical protein